MEKEILLYQSFDSWTATDFVTALADNADNDISVRVNTNGGEPECGFAMIAKFSEHTKGKTVKGDGKAYSMGAYFFCYTEDTECLDVTEFLIHRAAYPSWMEDNMDDAMRGNLARVNDSLKKAFTAKVDVAAFEAIMQKKPGCEGKTVEDIFSDNSRLEVFLTAKEAKKIGLVARIVNITPTKKAEIDNAMVKVSERRSGMSLAARKVEPVISEEEKNKNKYKIMTREQLKAENPALYKELINAGKTAERKRVEAYMEFSEADLEGVKAAIKKGEKMSQAELIAFMKKDQNKTALKEVEKGAEGKDEQVKDAAGNVVTITAEATQTEEQKKMAAFEAEVDKNLGLGKTAEKK